MIKKLISILLITVCFSSCVDKYFPKVDEYANVLVVDGMLTNYTDQVYVNLSYSMNLYDEVLEPVTGCNVYVVENDENTVSFIEMDEGRYKPVEISFKGTVGKTYQLFVELPSGRKYESEVCIMLAPSSIDSVYGNAEEHEVMGRPFPEQGIQFYIDGHNSISDTSYYMWQLFHTYEYQSSFDIAFTWVGYFKPFPKPDSLRTCWYSSQIQDIYTFSTRNLKNSRIKRFPLNYSSADTKELSIRYSLLVNQLSLEKQAYDFWEALRQQNISMENLHARQPYQLRGNIVSVEDVVEPILGYFTVASVSKKRIYVNRPTLDFKYMICEPDFKDIGRIRWLDEKYWPVNIVQVPSGALGTATQELCFDCQLEGGSLTPPDFWEN